MARYDLESRPLIIEHAAQFVLYDDPIINTALAQPLYHRLQTEEGQ